MPKQVLGYRSHVSMVARIVPVIHCLLPQCQPPPPPLAIYACNSAQQRSTTAITMSPCPHCQPPIAMATNASAVAPSIVVPMNQ
jgi:hypothetical protein